MNIPQVDYTARDFSALKSELTKVIKTSIPDWSSTTESDFGVSLVNAFSYMGDLMSYYIDRAANEANIQTTTQISNLINFAETYGYSPSGPVPSYVYASITNNTGATISLPVGTQIRVTPNGGPYSTIYFELTSALSNILNGSNNGLSLFGQALTLNTTSLSGLDSNYYPMPVTLGTSDGYAYQEFSTPDSGVIDGSMVVWVGQSATLTKWNYVNNLIDYSFKDTVYTTKIKEDGTTIIVFGDGVNGAVPNTGDPISVSYQTSYGSYGNLSSTDMATAVISYIPGYSSVPSGLYVSTSSNSATGGADMEDLSQLRVNIQNAMQTRNRAVTLADYASLAVSVPGVARASAASSIYTMVNLYIQPYSDGTATPGMTISGVADPIKFPTLINAVQNYVGIRCPVNTSLTINPPSYVPIFISANVSVSPNYIAKDVQINLAATLLDPTTGMFSYNGYGFGDDIYQADIYKAFMSTAGVSNVTFNYLYRSSYATINPQTVSYASPNVTINTALPHGLNNGDTIVISGVTPTVYNNTASNPTWTTQAGTYGPGSTAIIIPIGTTNPGNITVAGTLYKTASTTSDITIATNEIPYLTADNLVLTLTGGI